MTLHISVIPDLRSLPPYLIRGIQSSQAGFLLEFIPVKTGAGMTGLRIM
jgi:hypothetical protein